MNEFEFTEHRLCQYDRISAYQGRNTSSLILGRYCGKRAPSTIVSTGDIFLQFRTDDSVNDRGFKFTYTNEGCLNDIELNQSRY